MRNNLTNVVQFNQKIIEALLIHCNEQHVTQPGHLEWGMRRKGEGLCAPEQQQKNIDAK